MPIRPYLVGRTFSSDTVAAMSAALEEACEALSVATDNPERAMIAQTIISLVEEGQTPSAQLGAAVVKEMGGAPADGLRNNCSFGTLSIITDRGPAQASVAERPLVLPPANTGMSNRPSWTETIENILHSHHRVTQINDDLIERVLLTREVIAVSRAMMQQVDGLLASGRRTTVRTELRSGPIIDPGDWPSRASSL